ncbi:hypothetical protein KUDE01_014834 [Dissostichus eleginoides]|uniref:Uncharacterized protein n=1 Tax=Dissostichus eleginoides TaxID=100907 RepID=A0AAD9BW55_DISEL|nr:hypothetical protein KUDE01_014834 [Dissostichus eleginoides]
MTAALNCFDMERRERDLAVTFSITVQYGKGNSPFAAFPCNPPARLPTNPYAPPSTPSSTSSACAVKGEAYRESSLGGGEEEKKKRSCMYAFGNKAFQYGNKQDGYRVSNPGMPSVFTGSHLSGVTGRASRSVEEKSLLGQLARRAGPEDGCTVD